MGENEDPEVPEGFQRADKYEVPEEVHRQTNFQNLFQWVLDIARGYAPEGHSISVVVKSGEYLAEISYKMPTIAQMPAVTGPSPFKRVIAGDPQKIADAVNWRIKGNQPAPSQPGFAYAFLDTQNGDPVSEAHALKDLVDQAGGTLQLDDGYEYVIGGTGKNLLNKRKPK